MYIKKSESILLIDSISIIQLCFITIDMESQVLISVWYPVHIHYNCIFSLHCPMELCYSVASVSSPSFHFWWCSRVTNYKTEALCWLFSCQCSQLTAVTWSTTKHLPWLMGYSGNHLWGILSASDITTLKLKMK